MNRCDAWHDGHDCTTPGACQRALLELCERIEQRNQDNRPERETPHRDRTEVAA